MRYTIRRIAPGSALRVGCAVGWLVALGPALCLTVVVAQALRRLNQALARIEPIDITVLGQRVARIDFLELLRLNGVSQTVARLVGSLPLTFATLALLLTIAGALMLALAALLFSGGYNLLASQGWGLDVDVEPAERRA